MFRIETLLAFWMAVNRAFTTGPHGTVAIVKMARIVTLAECQLAGSLMLDGSPGLL